jgi:cell division protein FtsW (lipid II flippase)
MTSLTSDRSLGGQTRNRFWQQLAIATNWPILVSVAVLATVGCISIAAAPKASVHNQIMFICIGVLGMILMQWMHYARVARWSWAFYIVSMLLVIYTVIPGVPRHGVGSVPFINGAHAWIDLGVLHLEPAELAKLAFCMVLARYLRFRSNYRSLPGLMAPFFLALLPCVLILLQPALGMALLFLPMLFAMLFAAGAKVRHLLGIVGMGLLLLPMVLLAGTDAPVFRHFPPLLQKYQRVRIQTLFIANPNNGLRSDFQREQALTAFGSGGIAGKGAGHIPVGIHVPEAHNDMIIALIGEQFGLVGIAIVLAAYLVLFAAGIEIAAATKEPFGRLLAVGIVAMLTAQTFLNLFVCLRLAPVTGITLPFVSFGGSSLLASFLAAGLLLNIGQNRPLVIARSSFEFD